MQTIYQLAVTSAAAAAAAASIDVQNAGTIVGVAITLSITNTAGSDAGQSLQLSFGSTSTFGNDARQVIANHSIGMPTNAASGPAGTTVFVPMEVPVGQGERLYVHTIALGTAPASASHKVLVFVEDKSAGRSRFRP